MRIVGAFDDVAQSRLAKITAALQFPQWLVEDNEAIAGYDKLQCQNRKYRKAVG